MTWACAWAPLPKGKTLGVQRRAKPLSVGGEPCLLGLASWRQRRRNHPACRADPASPAVLGDFLCSTRRDLRKRLLDFMEAE